VAVTTLPPVMRVSKGMLGRSLRGMTTVHFMLNCRLVRKGSRDYEIWIYVETGFVDRADAEYHAAGGKWRISVRVGFRFACPLERALPAADVDGDSQQEAAVGHVRD